MKTRHGRMVGVQAPMLFLLLLISITPVHATDLHTRTDELMCGGTKLSVYTTCIEETTEGPQCTEQRFIFLDRKTGASAKAEGPGRRTIEAPIEPKGHVWFLDRVASAWGCFRGKGGPYVVTYGGNGGNCETCEWWEVFDLKGRKLLTDKSDKARRTDRERERFDKKWESLGLPSGDVLEDSLIWFAR